jgi:hypothetical protein
MGADSLLCFNTIGLAVIAFLLLAIYSYVGRVNKSLGYIERWLEWFGKAGTKR